jgi:predicted XRE-type DNA-binding protein
VASGERGRLKYKTHDPRRKTTATCSPIWVADPEREQLKVHLTLQIYRIIKSRGLTQTEAGTILGIQQPRVSARCRLGNVSVEWLMDFLIALDQDVEITVRPTRKEPGRVSIVLARSSPRGSRLEGGMIFIDL